MVTPTVHGAILDIIQVAERLEAWADSARIHAKYATNPTRFINERHNYENLAGMLREAARRVGGQSNLP